MKAKFTTTLDEKKVKALKIKSKKEGFTANAVLEILIDYYLRDELQIKSVVVDNRK